MEPIILTPRLKLTLVTTADRGSPEFEWYHEICSNKESTFWSLHGASQTLEDTDKIVQRNLPIPHIDGQPKKWRGTYAVHQILNPGNHSTASQQQEDIATEFIGLISLKSLDSIASLPLPFELSLIPGTVADPSIPDPNYLTLELAYMFLPSSWGHGYAGESLQAMFDACRRAPSSLWSPYTKVYIQSLVNSENSRSQRVMQKMEMTKTGTYLWKGNALYLGGRWRTEDTLWIYGSILV